MADYYFEVQRLDRELGERLALLAQRGELDRTMVVVTSDNGMPRTLSGFPFMEGLPKVYEITLDGTGGQSVKKVGSGVYLYQLRTGEALQTRTMMLMK